MSQFRRTFLGVVGSALGAGCADLIHRPDGHTPTEGAQTTVVEGKASITLQNEIINLRFDADSDAKRAGIHELIYESGQSPIPPVSTYLGTPVSRYSTEGISYYRTKSATVTADKNRYSQYQVEREYLIDGTPVSVSWTVSLPGGEPFCLGHLQITNQSDTSITLNHSDGDTHDGMRLFSHIKLVGRREETPGYRFSAQRRDATLFEDVPLWRSVPGIRYVTVFDNNIGATYGYLSGKTGPKLALARQNSLDYMVNEYRLSGEESITYRFVIAIHNGGEQAGKRGRELYERAYNWEQYA